MVVQAMKVYFLSGNYLKWKFRLGSTSLWSTGVSNCAVWLVIELPGTHVSLSCGHLLFDRGEWLESILWPFHFKSWSCPSNSNDFNKTTQAHVRQRGTKVIKYPPWIVSPISVYLEACCGLFWWVFRGSDNFGRTVDVRHAEDVVLLIIPKESSYFPMFIFSVSLTTRAQFHLSKTGSVFQLLILTSDVCGGTRMQRKVITTLLYPSGSCLNTFYYCQHLICRCNLSWGSWYEPKKSHYSTKLFSRTMRTQVLLVVTPFLKALGWVEYLRWKFRLVSAELWGIGEIRGTVCPSSELTATPGYMGCRRLFDRGKMPALSSWNSHWPSFDVVSVYNCTEVTRYGEIYLITRKGVIWRSSKRFFVNGEQGNKISSWVGLNSCYFAQLQLELYERRINKLVLNVIHIPNVSQLAVSLWWQRTTNGDA